MSGEDFPRGGGAPTIKKKPTKKIKLKDDLFDYGAPTIKKKPTKKRKLEDDLFDYGTKDDLFQTTRPKKAKTSIKPNEEEKAFAEVIAPGMLVLGCVRQVHELDMVVSLPNGLTGTVAITDFSDAYTSLLQALADGTESDLAEDKNLLSLLEIFPVGSVVRCKVKEVSLNGKKKLIKLTVNPKEVNSSIVALKNGMVLTGCISSCEDHGYLIDLGVKVTAFLSKVAAAKYLKTVASSDQQKKLSVGSYLHCAVALEESSDMDVDESEVVTIDVDPETISISVVEKAMKLGIQSLLPGFIVHATVTDVLENSLTVKVLSFTGTIHKQHLEESLKSYPVGMEVEVAVLFVNTMTKVVALTELPHLVSANLSSAKLFGNLMVGQILENVIVSYMDKKRGIHFKLPDEVKGFARFAQLPVQDMKLIQKTYSRGSSHRCRITYFDYLNKMAYVSLKENILNAEFFSYSDIKPGIVIECTVERLLNRGVAVKVTGHIQGFIPRLHLSDVPLAKPEKKFYVGKKLKCKVLLVDPEKSKLLLTCKKALVKSKLPVVSEYTQCTRGLVIKGFVASIKPNGIVVVFLNDIKGWMPKQEASFDEGADLNQLFFMGQVIECRVVKSDPDEEKLILSQKMNPMESVVQQHIPQDIAIGEIMSCVVHKVDLNGLMVRLPDGLLSFLPKMHLSDHHSNMNILLKMFKEGDTISDTMVFNKTSTSLTMTKKTSVIQQSLDGTLVNDFSLLQPGMILPGVVKKKMTYGLFVEINGLTGLVPIKYLVDKPLPDPLSLFYEGQSVMPKVTEVNNEKKRFLLSLRMSDCYHGDTDVGINLLEDYFEEYQKIVDHVKTTDAMKSHLGQLSIGSIVSVEVTKVVESGGILCQLKGNQVKGFVALDNMAGVVCKERDELEAVVLFIDVEIDCVQLSLNKDLVNAVKKFVDNKYSKARVGQVIKAEVHLVTSEFVLVLLKGHSVGRIAFLPAKRHLNDIMEQFQYHVGQVNPVLIKREFNDMVFASLRIHENVASIAAAGKSSTPAIGSVVKARVQKVYPMQMNIAIEGTSGRVHITEVTDDIETGTSPFKSFSEGSELTVKVIGYREEKTHKYLSSDRATTKRVLLECSMKPSKMSSAVTEDLLHRNFSVGDKVNGFVISIEQNCIQMQVTPTVKGTVHILNASNKIKILTRASSHFKVGCGYRATVLAVGDNNLELTIADRTGTVEVGDLLPAIILKVVPHRGLLLQLPHRQIGDVYLTHLSDHYKDFEKHNFKENQFVRCRILSSSGGPRLKWIASIRQSKLESVQLGTGGDRDISGIDVLKEGDICRGYVVSNRDKGILVSLSSEITGRVKPCHLSKYFIGDVKSVFFPGKVVTAKILSLDRASKHLELSLLEKDTGVEESIPADVLQRLSLRTASAHHKMECEPANGEKSFLKLFCPVTGSSKKVQKEMKQKVSVSPKKESLISEDFWSDKFVQPSGVAEDSDSDELSELVLTETETKPVTTS